MPEGHLRAREKYADEARGKTWIFTAIVVLSNAFGNLLLDKGVHGDTVIVGFAFSWWLIPGIALLILYMLSRMTLLGWADLTFVLPVTAIGYVLSTLLAVLFLGESVSTRRWVGTLFIMAGTVLVGITAPKGNK